jgi:hypothetical protein
MEAVIELYKCAWNIVDTYTCQPPNYTPLLGDRSVHSSTTQNCQLETLPRVQLLSQMFYFSHIL